MRTTTVFSFFLATFVFVTAALTSAANPWIFVNGHAALVVFGGTFSAAAISFGLTRLFTLLHVLYRRILKSGRDHRPREMIEKLMILSDIYRTNPERLREEVKNIEDPFLKEALELVADNYIAHEDLMRILATRTMSVYQRYQEEALKFKALAKFPPAFGLMGAVMGMIGIMAQLGKSGTMGSVGPSLALALVGTLYGVALANLVILPLAENLQDSAREVRSKNMMITEAVRLLLQKKNPVLMAEDLNSFLLANERLDWKANRQKVKEAA
ncbi:MAG: MotA/TolQ/ExbB proton channel family protein [Bdellovibrionota bacterium]